MQIAYLEKVVPEKNQYRYYAICINPILIWRVGTCVREWGRYCEVQVDVQENWFSDEKLAKTSGVRKMESKLKRGYRRQRPIL